ncbi:MAG: SPASM domain-containing protein [Candidatus Omnitrophica bacterium]|nr:SPASM domain-containing protein [Candidatus Omnitrophota bacterium]
MKASQFNIAIPHYGSTLLFNTLTMALAEFRPEEYCRIESLSSNSRCDDCGKEEWIKELWGQGFIIDDDFSEIEYLRNKFEKAKQDSETLAMVICPTLECNFSCLYCYECHCPAEMNQETEESIIRFIDQHVQQYKRLDVTWFGGEPLLNFPTIERLSFLLMEICRKNNVKYSAILITNGFLLEKPIRDKLSSLCIKGVQFSIDGPAEIHDKRRFLKDGQPTFYKVFNNFVDFVNLTEGISVGLRINVDKRNLNRVGDLEPLFDLINSRILPDKIKNTLLNVCFGLVTPTNNKPDSRGNNYYSYEEFLRLILAVQHKYNNKYFFILKPQLGILPGRMIPCGVIKENVFIVDGKGDLYKCLDHCGMKSEVVGNIIPRGSVNERISQWDNYSPFENTDCVECKILPLCMGGCPKKNMEMKRGKKNASCLPQLNQIRDQIEQLYQHYKMSPQRQETNAPLPDCPL